MLAWKIKSKREADLEELHAELLRTHDHEGSAHCICTVAVELRAFQASREKLRLNHEADKQTLESSIGHGLRAAIEVHGPITQELIPSAAKRIAGALRAAKKA